MVDAVRLVVGQAHGAGRRCPRDRAHARRRRDGHRDRPERCAAQRAARGRRSRALAVIGTYELTCSERALRVLRPAGLLLVSPLNAADDLPGALRLAPTTADQGTAAAQLAEALGATRVAIVSQRPRCGRRVRDRARAAAAARGIDPVVDLDASATPHRLAGRAARGRRSRSSRWPARPARGRTSCCARSRRCPRRAPGGGRAADVRHARVPRRRRARPPTACACSRGSCPPSSSAASARIFASAYADLHGQPPPVAIYAADAAERRARRRSARPRLARARWPRRCARCPPTTRCSAAGPRPRTAASHRDVWPCSWSTAERSASSGWSRSSEPLPPSGDVK